ncbi:diaminopimelate epimerase [Candidatus Woesearchaeota archaeon]|nr:diaminopimelate epimerase [Candidatus Woesearchaeota archaeon]
MKFTKMHGTGNDYVYIDMTINYYNFDPSELAKRISDRHFGVGSDGLILVYDSKVADFRMRIFNADGSEAEMCGNGIRAFAKFCYDHRLTSKKTLNIETGAGIKTVEMIMAGSTVTGARVDMGVPELDSKKIPVSIDKSHVVNEELAVDDRTFKFTAVSMGNPHCVIFVDSITDELVKVIGPKIESHPIFPKKVNVEFAKVLNSGHVEMRVWERGSGETMSCGTGASAVAVACALNKKTGRNIKIHLAGGQLDITWAENSHVYMTGPAEEVFEGVYNYKN